MTQITNISEVDDSIKQYIHILKTEDKNFAVFIRSLSNVRYFSTLKKALVYCSTFQQKSRMTILVHDTDGAIIKIIKPAVGVISSGDTTRLPRRNKRVKLKPIGIQ